MSTTTTRPAEHAERAEQRNSPGTGTAALVRLALRRDRIRIPAWVAGLGLYVLYVSTALPVIAGTDEELGALAPLLEQPVGRMFTGPAYGMDALTHERFFASGYVLYLFVLAALMSILLVTRHTRAEEESGRAELVRASVVGRHAHLTAALIVAALANLGVLVVITAMSVAGGYGAMGSLLIGTGTALVGMAFAGIAAVTAQLSENSRPTSGMAGAVLGAAFALRALGDMAAVGGTALSWASPLGWASQTAPFVHDRWWPLALLVALAIAAVAAGFALQHRRDLGAGLLASSKGPARARDVLGTPLGLAARLQLAAVVAWGLSITALGVLNGAFTQLMVEAADDMPEAFRDVFGSQALMEGYLAFIAAFNAYIIVAYIVFAVQGLRAEETGGRAEAVLATSTSRVAWAGSHLLVIALGATMIMVVAGAGTGLGAAISTGDWSLVGTLLGVHLNLLPGLLLVLGLCGLLFGWLPTLMAPLGWTVVGLVVVAGVFSDLLDLPDWVQQLSPLSHPAQLPVEDFAATPLVWLGGLTVLGVGLGLVGLSRRQIYVR